VLLNRLISFGIPNPNFIVKWVNSFLRERKRKIKVSGSFSDWVILKGGVFQGTWLGPLTFIAFINNLMIQCRRQKFIDDVTIAEILKNDTLSTVQEITDELIKWPQDNRMLINCNKTKEMIIEKAKPEIYHIL